MRRDDDEWSADTGVTPAAADSGGARRRHRRPHRGARARRPGLRGHGVRIASGRAERVRRRIRRSCPAREARGTRRVAVRLADARRRGQGPPPSSVPGATRDTATTRAPDRRGARLPVLPGVLPAHLGHAPAHPAVRAGDRAGRRGGVATNGAHRHGQRPTRDHAGHHDRRWQGIAHLPARSADEPRRDDVGNEAARRSRVHPCRRRDVLRPVDAVHGDVAAAASSGPAEPVGVRLLRGSAPGRLGDVLVLNALRSAHPRHAEGARRVRLAVG